MKNISEIRFVKELKDCYFHKDRKYECGDIKQKALEAMLMLWNADNVECCGYIYSQDMIRNMMLNKMMPEDLDRAIVEAERKRWRISFDDFVEMIFVSVLLGDAIVDIQFRKTYLKGAC